MIEVKKISFGSFIKLCSLIAFSFGIVLGLYLFIISIFGGNAYCNLGSIHLTGILAGVVNIFAIPIVVGITGILYSIIVYVPFNFINKYILKGIKLRGVFSFIEEAKDSKQVMTSNKFKE